MRLPFCSWRRCSRTLLKARRCDDDQCMHVYTDEMCVCMHANLSVRVYAFTIVLKHIETHANSHRFGSQYLRWSSGDASSLFQRSSAHSWQPKTLRVYVQNIYTHPPTHTHTHTQFLSHTHSLTHLPSLSLSLSLSHAHTGMRSLAQTLTWSMLTEGHVSSAHTHSQPEGTTSAAGASEFVGP